MSYNGHKNWTHWNVSLWLHNNEPLYRRMLAEVRAVRRRGGTRIDAAEALRVLLADEGITHTPDGAAFTKTAIRAAMVDVEV